MQKFNSIKVSLVSLSSVLLGSSIAHSADLPRGAQVLHGDVSFLSDQNNLMVNASGKSKNNVIRWESFDIGQGNTVSFGLNNYLNLVGGSKASVINGTLMSVGDMYLINPNGITLGLNSEIAGKNIHLSTAKITDDDIAAFASTGILDVSGKGMGRVSLLGRVSADNLTIDAGQVIIRDVAKIQAFNDKKPNTTVSVTSSVKRVDVGGSSGTDLALYGLNADCGLVDHTGEYAVSTADEFMAIAKAPEKSYFLTNDIDLGVIDTTADANLGFSGRLDGAYNNVTYSLSIRKDSGRDIGLFSTLKDAEISNLGIRATINVTGSASDINLGALAGSIQGGTYQGIDAYGADIYVQGSNINLGSIAGEVVSGSTVSTFSKVTGSLSTRSESLAEKNSSLTAGSLFGYADTINADDTVSGYSEILKSLGDGSAQLTDNRDLATENGYLLTDNGTYRLSGFYDPLFIRDFTFDYDGSAKNYRELMSSEAFRLTDYVSIEKDYQGLALEGGVYSHTLKSATSGRGFYFVDEKGSTSATGKGLITIIAPEPEPIPDSGTTPEPETVPDSGITPESEAVPDSGITPEYEAVPDNSITPWPDRSTADSEYLQPSYSYERDYETAGNRQHSYFSAGDGRNLQSPFAKVARCGFCQGRSQFNLPLKTGTLFKLPDQQPGAIALYNAINSTEKVLSAYSGFSNSGSTLASSQKEEEDKKKSHSRS